MMKRAALALGSWACLLHVVTGQENSALWGRDGESWDPAGRLPDVSFAGYACGEKPLPKIAVVASVKDFGAKGDGTTDDSDAFLAAIAKVERGAISVPAGRYKITRIIEIRKPGIVLRGAGPDQSVLVCPVPLNDIKPDWGATTTGQKTSNYSWSGGFVWFKGADRGARIGNVIAAAKRGDRTIKVTGKTGELKPGSWIEIKVRDGENKSLLDHLYSGDPGKLGKIKAASHSTTFVSRIRGVKGDLVALERPLRIDLRPEWKPEVRIYQPEVVQSGIEDLGFEFPERAYGGHFSDLGFNAVAFSGVAHCWARNLTLTNADSGIFASGRFCTIDGLHCRTSGGVKEKNDTFGHHGASLTGHDNLFTRFTFDQRFIHDITVSGGAGNVSSSGRGTDLAFDHHKRAPYDNVFTDIDLGKGSRMWKCGGGADLGRHCGAHGTFWNIRAKQAQKHPGEFGPPSLNLVAVETKEPSQTDIKGRWFEAISPDKIQPANLHEAQWKKRMKAR
jgi:hypothetical protein